jgi:hypothetical protein
VPSGSTTHNYTDVFFKTRRSAISITGCERASLQAVLDSSWR